ncbi:hypothetical protein [Anaerosinus massiliensis]|uniref:hypothetical protein n=1 Tax=Massilibacillus massiliensis TaxID=1806837 RepID=UPI000DA604D8|nr:hypothetical protein [Massilibacillus massiliensis]
MMKKTFNILRKGFVGVVWLILLGAAIFPLVYRILNPADIERREENLRTHFQAIEHPSGATQLDFKIHSKVVKRWINAEYKHEHMSAIKIEQYYYQELTQQGWVKKSVNQETDKRFRVSTYKKGDYEIYVSPSKTGNSWSIGLNYRDFFGRFGL